MTVRTRPSDQEQRDLILSELERSMLVEAAAGTGKTESIVGRMVELLKRGACGDVSSMVAVTFTRKAAAELRARFQLGLERAVREAEGEEHDRLQAALEGIEQCFVGTIHSFCARLLRERPVEAGVDLAFKEIDSDEDEVLKRQAWHEYCAALIGLDPRGTMESLTALGIEPASLEKAFEEFALYPDVGSWPVPEGGGAGPPGAGETARRVEEYVAHMRRLAPRLPTQVTTDKLAESYRRIPRVVNHYDLSDPADLADLLERQFDKKSGFKVTQWTAEGWAGDDARAEAEEWDDFRSDFARPFLARCREMRYRTVIRALSEGREVYDSMRAERGQLNFQDLLMAAARLLKDKPHIRRYFASRYTHLLVDEFQDTDPVQAEVIMLLTSTDPSETDWRRCRPRGGSLFVVGDPKQSIYRFRRADIQTYEEVKRIITSSGPEPGLLVTLSTNFRTVGQVIDWANDCFRPEPGGSAAGDASRFPEEDCEESPGYVPLDRGRTEGSPGGLEGVFLLDVPAAVGNKEYALPWEADLIARFIRSRIDSGETVARTLKQVESGMAPELGPADFMVLTRKKDHLSVFAAALQAYGIPCQVTGGTELNEVEELSLLRSVLAAVARPDDPVAVVGALRGEALGVSDAALYRYRKAGGSFNYMVRGLPEGLAPADREAFEDSFSKLREYRRLLDGMPAVPALESIVSDLGLMVLAGLREGGDIQAGSLGKAIELVRAMQRDEWSLERLVEYLGEMVERRQTYDGVSALSREVPAVRLMNLHKAKGLEAPVVFLASAFGQGTHPVVVHIDRTGNEVLGYMAIRKGSGRYAPLLAHPEGWEPLAEKEDAFRNAEELRLRYVAATRAACALSITERMSGTNQFNCWQEFKQVLAGRQALEDPGDVEPHLPGPVPVSAGEAAAAAQAARESIERISAPGYEVRRAKELALSGRPSIAAGPADEDAPDGGQAADEDAPDGGQAADEDARGGGPPAAPVEPPGPAAEAGESGVEFGEAVHRLLEVAMKHPDLDLESWAVSALEEDGREPGWARAAARAAGAAVASDLWRRASASGTVLTEVPFHLYLEDGGKGLPVLVRGAIDLAFEEPGGWVLVDYKTDAVGDGAGAAGLAEKYAPQIELYARAWRICTGEEVAETGFFFTSTGQYLEVARPRPDA